MNRTSPSTQYSLTWLKLLTPSTGRHFGQSLNALGVLQSWCRWSGSWRHDWPGPLQWQCDGCFHDQQRREAGLRTSPGPLQHLFHLYAVQDLEKGGLHSLPLGRLPLQPALTYKDEEPANSPLRGSLCRRLRTNGPCRTRPAADAGPLLRGIQALRSDNQSRKDGGALPTCTILTPPSPTITIDNKPLANVEHFKYLGSTISCDGSLDREIDTRINKANQALGSLRNQVLSKHNIHQSTKLKVYNAVVLPSLLYGCDTWTLYRRHIKKLELFHMRAPCSILGIRWQDITNLRSSIKLS